MSIYEFSVKNVQGEFVSLADYQGKALLIVNIATKCGLTPQLEGLEALHQKYKDQGFEVLGFPCDQFLNQTPEDDAGVEAFCSLNYGVTFTNFAKVDVNGDEANALFKHLKQKQPVDKQNEGTSTLVAKLTELGQIFEAGEIQWNFTKFLINREGEVVERYSPTVTADEIEADLKPIL
ncbi:MAG: glutathione peroxidase [Vibrio sp.]